MTGSKGIRTAVMNGSIGFPKVGLVRRTPSIELPYVVVDPSAAEVSSVSAYLQDLLLSDQSPLTLRSYAYDLLRWFRILWALRIEWEKATRACPVTV